MADFKGFFFLGLIRWKGLLQGVFLPRCRGFGVSLSLVDTYEESASQSKAALSGK
ncbi:MAG: hypothetical protein IKB97_00570 [Bacteroidaceae bacterium]|nr:hypothetical protein [Bacteroidaceae bacterium]